MSTTVHPNDKPVIGITLGDINGIGPEVVIKSLSDSRILNLMTPVIYGSTKVLSFYRKTLDNPQIQYAQVKQEADFIPRKINVVNCWQDMMPIEVGSVTREAGEAAFLALQKGVDHLKSGVIDAIVTAPINKKNIQQQDFQFAGHTEYFAHRFEVPDSLMFMISEQFRVAVATGHIPLKDVAASLTREVLESKLSIMLHSLRIDFGLNKPRIAVMGLNPHAGEEGLLGHEEEKIITPLINRLRDQGNLIFGPFPADGFFGRGDHLKFDGVLAMYHDQGLIPFKLSTFQQGVNFTAGLPVVRTSPDHGTAYSLAGKNAASELSMRTALYAACEIVEKRKERENLRDSK